MLSVIIPVLNEEKALPLTLTTLLAQCESEEIIVVDGGSTDNTASICSQYSQIKFLKSDKGRAKQMNVGARNAKGDNMLFLHGDTLLPDKAISDINRCLDHSDAMAGGFRHSFGRKDWRLRFISFLDNRRCQQTRIIYGDQALFIKRHLFNELNGFPEDQTLEDVHFCETLNKVTRPVILDSYVNTDPRKFLAMGVWRSLFRVAVIQARHELGLPVDQNYPFFAPVR